MHAPLSVRIFDGFRSQNVTQHTKDLKFRKTAPGGHHQASMQVTVPRDTFTDLGPADRVYIYDERNAAPVWEGYTENPGVTDGPAGQSYDISAMGGMVLASDQSHAVIYLDRALDKWRRADGLPGQVSSSTSDVSEDPASGAPALKVQFNPGNPVGTSARASLMYDAFKATGQVGAAIGATIRGGSVDANYVTDIATMNEFINQRTLSPTPATVERFLGSAWVTGRDLFYIHLTRISGGATNVTTDNVWAALSNVAVAGSRRDRFGALVVPTRTSHILASEVVEDLLGRMLTFCDPTLSVVETTAAAIDQLAYHEGTKAAKVLEDLATHEPDFLWEILHSTPRGHLFRYRAWPTTPRYEISTKDGYDAPGGEVDLCNRVVIYWADAKGNPQATVVTSVVPELGSRVRDAEPVTLPDGRGSEANALRIGGQILAAKAKAPRAATAKVRRPILDHLTGRQAMPWEIEPGYLVRVRETGEDLRLTEMAYEDDDVTTTLTLGEPVLTDDQRLARLWASKVSAA